MNRLPAEVIKRQVYLLTLFSAYIAFGLSALCCLTGCAIFIFILILPHIVHSHDSFWFFIQSSAPILALILFLTGLGLLGCSRAKKRLDRLPYVPPINSQIEDLPVEEVLLRGSQSPQDISDELLRPVTENRNTPAGELLRPSTVDNP